jgi:hypothetical protein
MPHALAQAPRAAGIANSWRPRCGSGGRCGADSGRILRHPREICSVVHRFRDAAIGLAGKPATPMRERCCDASVRHPRLRPTTRWMLARRGGSDTDTAAFAEHRWTFCHALAGTGVAHVGGRDRKASEARCETFANQDEALAAAGDAAARRNHAGATEEIEDHDASGQWRTERADSDHRSKTCVKDGGSARAACRKAPSLRGAAFRSGRER